MFLIVCFHFSRRLPDRRRHKTNKGRTNRRSLPNCQQNGRIAARHGRLAFRDRAFWQKEGRSAARQRRHTGRWHGGRSAARMNRRRKGEAAAEGKNSGRWHGGRSTGRQRRNTGRWHKAGRRNSRGGAGGRGGVPAASARRVSGTAEKVRTEEEHRPVARRAAAHKKACAAAGPYPEVRTTIIYYRFCSPRIRIATSRIVVSSNVTTPPSGPGSK